MNAPFVGRTKEKDTFRSQLEAALSGKGRTLLVTGHVGIGKTRFVEEALKAIGRKDVQVLTSRCLFLDGVDPYLPFLEIMKGLEGATKPGPSPSLAGDRVPIGLTVLDSSSSQPGRAGKQGALSAAAKGGSRATPEEQDLKKARDRIYQDLTGKVLDTAKERPVVIVIDDLHWADKGTLSMLFYLSTRIRSSKAMIICTVRTEELARRYLTPLKDTVSRLRQEGLVNEIDLGPLDRASASQMLESIFGMKKLPHGLAENLYARTDGNPFLMEELAGSLLEQGGLKKLDLERLKIPNTIDDLVQARLDDLKDDERMVVEVASVCGTEFTLELIDKVLPGKGEENVDALDMLIEKNLVEEMVSRDGGCHYRFAYKIIREVVYEKMSKAKRRLMHERIGTALEGTLKGNTDRALFLLAHHFRSSKPSEKAIDYSLRAGELAFALYALDDAYDHFKYVYDTLTKMPPRPDGKALLLRTTLPLVELTNFIVDPDKAREVAREAISIARELGDDKAQVRAIRDLANLDAWSSQWEPAMENNRKAYEIARRIDDNKGIAAIQRSMSYILLRSGDAQEAERRIQESIEISRRIGDMYNLGSALVDLGNIQYYMYDLDAAVMTYEESIRVLEAVGDQSDLMRASVNLATAYNDLQDDKRSEENFERAVRIADRIGDKQLLPFIYLNYTVLASKKGQREKAFDMLSMGGAILEQRKDQFGIAIMHQIAGIAHGYFKEWDKSVEHYELAVGQLTAMKNIANLRSAYMRYAGTLASMGRTDDAIKMYERSMKLYGDDKCLKAVEKITGLIDGLKKKKPT